MLELSCKTKGNASPQGKPRVYFTCHPADFDRYFEKLSQDIFQAQDCAVYYTSDMSERISTEDRELQLGRMNLFVIPVSLKLLIEPNRAMDEDFAFAVKEHIPVLPIVLEPGLDPVYSREDRFGDRNYLMPTGGADGSGLSYEEKLRKYLQAVLIDDETAERVRAAFDCYVFLSYRKKDRRYADELMRLIHNNPVCRDIAIWYDEYLTPGEGFNEAIAKMMDKSKLYTLLVTPNLINEENYVHTTEYPAAREAGKPIFPAEMEATDRTALEQQYEGIPACAEPNDEDAFRARLQEALLGVALRENDSDPTHNYLIGLAYLEGIDVEVDRDRALELITSAAEAELPEAMERLRNMYLFGEGVALDYMKSLFYAERLVKQMEKAKGEKHPDTLNAQSWLAVIYGELGDYNHSLEVEEIIYALRSSIHGEKDRRTLVTMNNLALTYGKLGDQKRELRLQEQAYAMCLEEFGEEDRLTLTVMSGLGITYHALGNTAKALELLKKAYSVSCYLSGEEDADTIVYLHNFAAVIDDIGDHEKALKMREKAYSLSCKQYGEDDPGVVTILAGLAVTYGHLGNREKEMELQERVVAISGKMLGEAHPDTLTAIENLAMTCGELGDNERKRALLEKVYDIRGKIFGKEHPNTLAALSALGKTYEDLGEHQAAFGLLEKAYSVQLKTLGKEHPDTQRSMQNIAAVAAICGNNDYSTDLLIQLYGLQKRTLGEEDKQTLLTLHDLGTVYNNVGKYDAAIEILTRVYSIRCKVFGKEDKETLKTLAVLSTCYSNIGNKLKTLVNDD